jgi:6-phosphogluconolactonase
VTATREPDPSTAAQARRPGRAERLIVTAPDAFAATGAEEIARAIRDICARPGSNGFSLALSGGSTPGPVHECLALEPDVPWADGRVYFADERAVPADDPESNYLLARESLLSRVPVPVAQVHRMEAEAPDADAAAERYAALLPERIDVLVLGIGSDGHTASLFPHAASLREAHRGVLAVEAPEGVRPSRRLTLTPPAIRAARRVVVLVAGASKAEAAARALAPTGAVAECPARLARPAVWVLDSAAAAGLGERSATASAP